MTHFHSIPELGEGIVILTNSQRSWPFMGEVLRQWGRWTGTGMVKMSRLAYTTSAMRVLIALLLALTLWRLYTLARGRRSGTRRFAPLSPAGRARRLLQATTGLGLIAFVAWRASLPYVFESAIFPADIGTAAVAVMMLGATLLLAAMFPRGGEGQPPV